MLKKNVPASKMEVVDASTNVPFSKGTKFVYAGKIGIVTEVTEADNASMRRIRYDDGTEEIVLLSTLLKDSRSADFKVMEKDA